MKTHIGTGQRGVCPPNICVCEVWSPRKAKEIPESKGLSHPTRSLAPQKKIDELKAYKCLGYFIERGENSSICKKKKKKMTRIVREHIWFYRFSHTRSISEWV